MEKNVLEKYINSNIFVSIFDDYNNPENFYVGFVLACDEEYLLLEAVDKYGNADGLRLILLSYIFAVEENLLYCNKIKRLFDIKKQERIQYCFDKKSLLSSLLCYAKEKNQIVELSDDETQCGFVSSFDDSVLTLDEVDLYGAKLGKAVCQIENINNVKCNSRELADITLLM